ncbi:MULTISPECIES: uracil-DNA glycosylase [Lactiplantibacillus]|uniref:Uracil-DNA glycosylase n=3 Tax=Lactiplantibacillus pentosus TaxID=1589 RepID=A0A241RMN6_LACPE|nr:MULTISPECIES: uracil-DNA glycosylase [Lactiplantibacillus]MCH4130073.1 uracil-DNA glycosylase [Lactiplantibacillus sp.]BBM20944.1 uracil-DNA glycosylase [Lactiplantibacillus plantarum]ASG79157.1 uracil-DNA glycosylase [Lactiplantibacillus pentosus]AUI79535.1 uracil-DNA glycosylase [Lactiplantibacillus pentosus]AYG36590.1 uracil-DNA glycosylase [Lactiplantibacillus pentosus]
MKAFIHTDWWDVLKPEFEKPYYHQLHEFLKNEYRTKNIHPDMYNIFQAFEWTPFADTKVVILGQDPYHGPGQAHGLSFSVLPGVAVPPSLGNIYKELQDDVGCTPVEHGYLESWAKQGVLLLNSVLTVQNGVAFSHAGKGWERLTDVAIQRLSERETPVVFILWGKAARSKIKLINTQTNVVLQAPHPSPLSAYRGFFGSKPFSKTNIALTSFGEQPINWQLPEHVNLEH